MLIFDCESNKTSTGNVHMTRYIIIVEVRNLMKVKTLSYKRSTKNYIIIGGNYTLYNIHSDSPCTKQQTHTQYTEKWDEMRSVFRCSS